MRVSSKVAFLTLVLKSSQGTVRASGEAAVQLGTKGGLSAGSKVTTPSCLNQVPGRSAKMCPGKSVRKYLRKDVQT